MNQSLEGHCSLAFLGGLLSWLSDAIEDHCWERHCLQWAGSVLNQKSSPTDLPIGQPDEDSSPINIPTSQTTLVCIKSQKKIACMAHGQDGCGNENGIIYKSESEKITSQNCFVPVCHSGA